MMRPWPWFGQGLAYLGFAVAVGVLSVAPSWSPLGQGEALIKLSFSHAGQRKVECRILRPEEIAALPPNMRRPQDCPRERHPVQVELSLNGSTLFAQALAPSGFWRDGTSNIYRRIPVPAGHYRLTARLRDSERRSGFDYERHFELELVAGQNLVIDFQPQRGGFILR